MGQMGQKDAAEIAKNKKKKKKSGMTGQQVDDIDEIIAELGEGPPMCKLFPAGHGAQTQPEQVSMVDATTTKGAAEERGLEFAAAKKRKKKEKEGEKKLAAAAEDVKQENLEETKTGTKSTATATDKKVPRHVREIQQRLAKLKEMEGKKKREEEERLRKEEEERRLLEERERQEEEKKNLRKDKRLQKKQEGRILTGKQKQEARRQESIRKQLLSKAEGDLPIKAGGIPTKRPSYQTKKSKLQSSRDNPAQAVESTEAMENQLGCVAEVDSMEPEMVEEVNTISLTENPEAFVVSEEDDNEDEWDAKSWDDADLKLPSKSAFADEEEVDSEPECLVKKAVKNTQTSRHDAGPPEVAAPKIAAALPIKSQDFESKIKLAKTEVKEENKQVEPLGKKGTPNSEAQCNQSESELRSPICCIMGHVDAGKTKLLDFIRGTNVQEGEAGGITQQIGATYFPAENIRERTKELKAVAKLKVPGLLVIDTPGHESFANLRSRGSGLCDIAIVVVDIMHGLKPQTIESLKLLKKSNTEFIVALNKVDKLYGWKTCQNAPIKKTLKQQSKDVQREFETRLNQVITQFKEQELDTGLYYKNKEMGQTFSIVPTSATSGDGIADLLLLLVLWTQKSMAEKLTYNNEVQCTVLEVKVAEGHGTTIDVLLVNGMLREGDRIVVCGMQGPILTTIRALLTPHPMKELRVTGTYLHHKEIKAALAIKISAQGLEHAIAGTSLYVVGPDDDLGDKKEAVMEDMEKVMSKIDKNGEGVFVRASTLGSLEALLEFLKSPDVNIPVSDISIGPVHKKDVMKASVMVEKKKEHAAILAFSVKVAPEARELAHEVGVKIFTADIIYHLKEMFKGYIDKLKEEKKKEAAEEAVFPCILKTRSVIRKKDPLLLEVEVFQGRAKVGTPICVPRRGFIVIGHIASIQKNYQSMDFAKKGEEVAVKIVCRNLDEQQKLFGRHFGTEDELVSQISRRSIDLLKAYYRDEVSKEEWTLVAALKKVFKIQ